MIKKKFSNLVKSFWRKGSSDIHLHDSYVKSRRTSKSRFSVERLEPRIALDAAGVQRPTLERSHDIYLSNVGPSPIVFGKSDISITTDSFVVTSVAHGAVEKWTQADGWVDVSTKPTTSNPRELLKAPTASSFFQRRSIAMDPCCPKLKYRYRDSSCVYPSSKSI